VAAQSEGRRDERRGMEAFLQRFCGTSLREFTSLVVRGNNSAASKVSTLDEESCKLVGFWPLAHLPATVESRQFVILIAAEKSHTMSV
jgi:hypothetical protein